MIFSGSASAQSNGALEFFGEVLDRDSAEPIQGAQVAIFLGNARLEKVSTSKSGRFQFFNPLKLNRDYTVQVSKNGYPTKTIEIRGFVPDERLRDFKYGARLRLDVLKEGEIYPAARIVYNYEEDRFRYTDYRVVSDLPTDPNSINQPETGNQSEQRQNGRDTELTSTPNKSPRSKATLAADSTGQVFALSYGDTINRIDTSGDRQGQWTYFAHDSLIGYTSADKLLEGQYLNNQKVGHWVKYDSLGNLDKKMLFVDDVFAGPYKTFHENGAVRSEGTIAAEGGINTGTYKTYYFDGVLEKEYNYNNEGQRDGRQTVYYPNGQVAINANMSDGQLEGYITQYLESGALYAQQEFREGEMVAEQVLAQQGSFNDALFNSFINDDTEAASILETVKDINKVELHYEMLLKEKEQQIREQEAVLSQTREVLNLAQMENELNQTKLNRQKLVNIFTFVVLGLVVLIFGVMLFRYREKKRTSALLSAKNTMIEAKNRDIMDSMRYAQRIQDAILPAAAVFQSQFDDAFVLFKPKELVSGDFYWAEERDGKLLFAVVDCTGHGVPGAMVSMVGHNELNRAVKEFGLTQPAAILDKLNELVQQAFGGSDEHRVSDGMDIALCCYNSSNRTLEYAGANNPLYIARKSNNKPPEIEPSTSGAPYVCAANGSHHLLELKPNKRPIGPHKETGSFTNHRVELQPGDTLYLFSDGYADQFGGPKGKKFKYQNFRNLLLEMQSQTMQQQQKRLDGTMKDWMGNLEQIDDISIVGVRIG